MVCASLNRIRIDGDLTVIGQSVPDSLDIPDGTLTDREVAPYAALRGYVRFPLRLRIEGALSNDDFPIFAADGNFTVAKFAFALDEALTGAETLTAILKLNGSAISTLTTTLLDKAYTVTSEALTDAVVSGDDLEIEIQTTDTITGLTAVVWLDEEA